jgi:hypothetical protein
MDKLKVGYYWLENEEGSIIEYIDEETILQYGMKYELSVYLGESVEQFYNLFKIKG